MYFSAMPVKHMQLQALAAFSPVVILREGKVGGRPGLGVLAGN